MHLEIRPACDSDIPPLAAIYRELHELHVGLRPDVFLPAGEDDLRQSLAQLLSQAGFHVAVACDPHAVVGYAVYEVRVRERNAFMAARSVVHLHHMGVAGVSQRRGIGRALVAHVQSEAEKLGIDCVGLNFWSANASAKAFYESVGFRVAREVVELRRL
jgi:diamine N-acetyltransferase